MFSPHFCPEKTTCYPYLLLHMYTRELFLRKRTSLLTDFVKSIFPTGHSIIFFTKKNIIKYLIQMNLLAKQKKKTNITGTIEG